MITTHTPTMKGSATAMGTITFDARTGEPIDPATGQRFTMVRRHPFTIGPRAGRCHVCNGARAYMAHDGQAIVTSPAALQPLTSHTVCDDCGAESAVPCPWGATTCSECSVMR